MELSIYTDGSWDRNTKAGGWAYLIIAENNKAENGGFSIKTTNNIMELTAIMESLNFVRDSILPKGYHISRISIYTDSMYCVNSFTREKRNMYRDTDILTTPNGFKNKLHIKCIYDTIKRLNMPVSIIHTYGHGNNMYNDYVDRKAVKARLDGLREFKEHSSMN